MSDDSIIHFNPWRDFNDATPAPDVFGIEPDPEQIATFLNVVFGYCDGLIPVRGFVDKGQGFDGRPHNIWIAADGAAPERMTTFASWAWRGSSGSGASRGHAAAPVQTRRGRLSAPYPVLPADTSIGVEMVVTVSQADG